MALSKKKEYLTTDQYLVRVMVQKKAAMLARNNIRELNERYIRDHCKYRLGQFIPLPESKKPYTAFQIAKILVKTKLEEEGKDSDLYNVYFVYEGTFMGEGVANEPGTLRITDPKPTQNEKETTKEETEISDQVNTL